MEAIALLAVGELIIDRVNVRALGPVTPAPNAAHWRSWSSRLPSSRRARLKA